MNSKYGADVTDIGSTQVQVGTATLPDGTKKPIFEPRARSPKADRRPIEIVTDEGRNDSE